MTRALAILRRLRAALPRIRAIYARIRRAAIAFHRWASRQ